jgi:hypothetical protein
MGGGTHQTKKGGFLKIHADFNWDPRLKLDRRLNLIFFLNHDWKPEYGGELELWNKEMTAKVKGYAPKAGRIVVFYTADDSHHGHPDPLTCPENVTRKSLALYYYSNGRPKEEQSIPHTTKYKRRPGENFQRRSALGSKRILERFIPPIAHDILEYAKIRTRNRKNGGGEGEK